MRPRTLPAVKIIYGADIPDELHAGIAGVVEANLDVLPSWLVELDVFFTTDSEDTDCARMRPHVDYRRGKLTIGPGWLDSSPTYRQVVIVHEFMHLQLGPVHTFVVRLLDIAGRNNDALDTELREQFRVALEQTTVDLEALVSRLIARGDGTEPPPLSSGRPAPAASLRRGSPRAPGPAIARTTTTGAAP